MLFRPFVAKGFVGCEAVVAMLVTSDTVSPTRLWPPPQEARTGLRVSLENGIDGFALQAPAAPRQK